MKAPPFLLGAPAAPDRRVSSVSRCSLRAYGWESADEESPCRSDGRPFRSAEALHAPSPSGAASERALAGRLTPAAGVAREAGGGWWLERRPSCGILHTCGLTVVCGRGHDSPYNGRRRIAPGESGGGVNSAHRWLGVNVAPVRKLVPRSATVCTEAGGGTVRCAQTSSGHACLSPFSFSPSDPLVRPSSRRPGPFSWRDAVASRWARRHSLHRQSTDSPGNAGILAE